MTESLVNPDWGSTVSGMLAAGLAPLDAAALRAKIVGKTVYGDFGPAFKYAMAVDTDGSLEGRNNAGAHTFGAWRLNPETGVLTVTWQARWETSDSQAYDTGESLRLYEVGTGRWITSLYVFEDGTKRPLRVFPQVA